MKSWEFQQKDHYMLLVHINSIPAICNNIIQETLLPWALQVTYK